MTRKPHEHHLEWLCIDQIAKAGRFKLENGNAGACPHASEALKAEIMDVIDTARTFTARRARQGE